MYRFVGHLKEYVTQNKLHKILLWLYMDLLPLNPLLHVLSTNAVEAYFECYFEYTIRIIMIFPTIADKHSSFLSFG